MDKNANKCQLKMAFSLIFLALSGKSLTNCVNYVIIYIRNGYWVSNQGWL